ncbi:glycoside hydrolase family 99-like domain-containing protein [uncultured Cycloclasticus sp.]|uniref:glycoside hydrolase family 99-like domain-containing protein n=1 Tax=uncultured Cycloclasticus sp. TaxID=172194 RepID=UPI0025845DCA|nr:glycoside hydrolase family 99-like domain-containing protein [uncultured Cycloclasticus sp.]
MKIQESLLVSSPGNPGDGGLFYYDGGECIRLSELSTTGLFVDESHLVCGYQADGGNKILFVKDNDAKVRSLSESSIDVHDILIEDGDMYIVATETNEVVRLDESLAVKERWVLPGEVDAKHINSLTFYQGKLIASMFGEFEDHRGYKGTTKGAGLVIDVRTGEVLIRGLSQPHSLTIADNNNLLLCSSEEMELHEYKDFELLRKLSLPAYTRGVCLIGDKLYVGLSQSRNIDKELYSTRTCGIAVVDSLAFTLEEIIEVPLLEIYDIKKACSKRLIMGGILAEKEYFYDGVEVAENELNQAKHELNQAKGELNQAKGELNKAKDELIRVENSLSWRFTKPLRWLSYFLRGEWAYGKHCNAQINTIETKCNEDAIEKASFKVESLDAKPDGESIEIKPIAIYFPQLHSIPENDDWWGEGFTDWVNVKNAKPQYKGHDQPRVPMNKTYYDQSKLDVIREQICMAKEYGIYGFCHYHYWFDGKKLLETPTEALLNNKELDFPFCLSWANETWSRRWDGQDREILIKQEHPVDKERWKLHFDYLLQFWKDDRAIKVDGKPVFCIYNPNKIPEVSEMLGYWRTLAIDNGLKGLFFVHQKAHEYDEGGCLKEFDAEFLFEPNEAANSSQFHEGGHSLMKKFARFLYYKTLNENLKHRLKEAKVKYFPALSIRDYDKVWEIAISKRSSHVDVTFPGAFPDWDNTPRYKKNAIVYKGASPERFEYWLRKLVETMPARNLPENFIFINAWNEWAEGAYLEPDDSNEYGYLEAIKRVVNSE